MILSHLTHLVFQCTFQRTSFCRELKPFRDLRWKKKRKTWLFCDNVKMDLCDHRPVLLSFCSRLRHFVSRVVDKQWRPLEQKEISLKEALNSLYIWQYILLLACTNALVGGISLASVSSSIKPSSQGLRKNECTLFASLPRLTTLI